MWHVGLFMFLHPHMCAQCMMEVWAAEWSEWLWCQQLTSCGFLCPSRRRYLKFDLVPLISHVAYIWTEIPPRSIGCLEIDVNMNLFAIYLRPFGCLYSVTALQGHRRAFKRLGMQLWRAVYPITVWVCESEWKTKGKREISQYYQICWHCPIKWNANFQQGRKTQNKCGLKMTFWVSLYTLIHEHRRNFPKFCAGLSVTQHCGVACCLVIVNWPSLRFRLMGKTAQLLQLMTDMCLIVSQSQFWESPEVCQTKSNWSRIISKDLNWNNSFVELGLFGPFCVICILSWLYL